MLPPTARRIQIVIAGDGPDARPSGAAGRQSGRDASV